MAKESSDVSNTAKMLGIDFEDKDTDADDLGLSPEELKELMESSDGNDYGVPDEDELMRSLSELGIEEAKNIPSPPDINTEDPAVFTESGGVTQKVAQPVQHIPVSSATSLDESSATRIQNITPSNHQPSSSPLSPAPSLSSSNPPKTYSVPPVRYAAAYKKEVRQPKSAKKDVFDDLFDAFDFGRKAVVEAYHEAKQSVKDLNSIELRVLFQPTDTRLGMRVERRPTDHACEVTYVEPESASERLDIRIDDVVLEVNGRGGDYNRLMKMLSAGERPMELLLLRPIQILNSPMHFKLEDEMQKACRILKSLTNSDMEKDAMLELMSEAVGFVFMTTVKVGGLISGTGGTGILVSRLPDGSWSVPIAVGCFGMSVGLQIGASLADVMIVFMRPEALHPFASEEATDIHLGPDSGIVMGPVGRRAGVSQGILAPEAVSDGQSLSVPSIEDLQKESLDDHFARSRQNGDIIASKVSSIKPAYTYSHCKGLFVGVSLDGSALTVRHDVNEDFYGHSVNVAAALEGGLERPQQFKEFYECLSTAAGEKPPKYPPGGLFQPSQPNPSKAAWVPPRDKWQNESSQQPNSSKAAWVPPRDKWQSSAQPTRQNVPGVVSNPFVEVPGSVVAGSNNSSGRGVVTEADESFFSEEADESEEFVV